MPKDDFLKEQMKAFGVDYEQEVTGDIAQHMAMEKRRAMITFMQFVMDRADGRQWVYNILDLFRVFSCPFVSGQPDGTAFMSGIQAAGHYVLNDVMAARPEQFSVMMQEEQNRKKVLAQAKS